MVQGKIDNHKEGIQVKAINVGDNTYDIFDNTMQVYNKLPAQPYVVRFSKNRGFFLEKFNDLEIKESKIYGVHESKVTKVLNMFESQNRNLGVILSGDKGIGKSLVESYYQMQQFKKECR